MEFGRAACERKNSPPTAGHARVVDEDVIGRWSGRVRVCEGMRCERAIDPLRVIDEVRACVTRQPRNVLTERARLEPVV